MILRKTVQLRIFTGTLSLDTQNLSMVIIGWLFHYEIHYAEMRKRRISTDKRLKHGPNGYAKHLEVLELVE